MKVGDYAFWGSGSSVLGGEIITVGRKVHTSYTSTGRGYESKWEHDKVEIKGYEGYWFTPKLVIPTKEGKKLLKQIKELQGREWEDRQKINRKYAKERKKLLPKELR